MRIPMYFLVITAVASACLLGAGAQAVEEFHIGKAVVKNNLEIAPNYLTGVEMSKMPFGMKMGADTVHIEMDVHAAKGETHGFEKGMWIPYLKVTYVIEKTGSDFKASGKLLPMTAGDGPHYANSLNLSGPGQYHLTYHIEPPSANGFLRHVDKESGVPDWWQGFDVDWTFNYPAKAK